MAHCLRKTVLFKILTPTFRGTIRSLQFSTSGSENGDDDSSKTLQKKLNDVHSYEPVDDPESLVKTTIIKRNSILQQPTKTPEEMLEDAAQVIANRSEQETAEGESVSVGYDILQELEERLEEILSNDEDRSKPSSRSDEDGESDSKNPG
ncbi:uncharacterized protein LOC131436266 [Malaya genurostris]|uniref:uncharacterized protein LOC131436266 n=1 Tax=Malaya genurostris TaxID=325434 RepID=UPI0026F3BA95|nr:uncharacterized protein LOC131436266 [Malaya genurostris]